LKKSGYPGSYDGVYWVGTADCYRTKADETTEKEMAPVHGGAMGVMSYVRRTIFTFHMPAV